MRQARAASGIAGVVVLSLMMFVLGWPRQESSGHPERELNSGGRFVSKQSGAASATQSKQQPQLAEKFQSSVTRLTGRPTEDDFPALATGTDGRIWLAYVEYKLAQPIVMEQVRNRRFDSLIPKGHGDRIRLNVFDGKTWKPVVDVTGAGLDVWRPSITVDGDGNVVVAWAQKIDDDWEIFYRQFTPSAKGDQKGRLSKTVRVTKAAGSDFHVVSATDASGAVWLAWQGWRKDNFDIHVRKLDSQGPLEPNTAVANTGANQWSPAIAADSRGNVFLAWDTYDKGNYDVQLQVFGPNSKTLSVAASPRFEARATLACDAQDILWIAYVEGDEQWGKDFSVPKSFRDLGQSEPGRGLYVERTVKVKCLRQGKLMRPAGDLEKAFGERLVRNKSLPRLAIDAQDGVWLLFRHHRVASGRGEAWLSFATRYDGVTWSPAKQLPNSSNLLDNRPALAAFSTGVLAVYSSDTRTQTRSRDQNDLFATVLSVPNSEQKQDKTFKPDEPAPAAKRKDSHQNEAADVARMRARRIRTGSGELRLLRGDFHRHTEYTAHRDGDGLLEDSWRYALDAAALDWLGNGDHDYGYGHEYYWWQIQKVTDLFHNPPHFVAAMTYERSVRFPSGHRNVMFPVRGIRALPRFGTQKELLYGSAEKGSPDIKLLYDYLRKFGGICASHTSATNMGTDWRDNDPEVEPVVEIFQGCRQFFQNYEHRGAPRAAPSQKKAGQFDAGYVWNALEKGYRIGFQSSSDHFATHISYAVVLAKEASRKAIIDAFKKRHCYAANDNILLLVRSGDHLMGDEFETSSPPALQISVHGGTRIAKVRVIRNNKYVFTVEPDKQKTEIQYTDSDAKPGQSYYYYVRVEQADGNLAWSSPMWITYRN